MADALTAPLAVAALVLCAAALGKLRAPGTAAAALRTMGLPGSSWLVRALALPELAVGLACLLAPGRAAEILLTLLYATFALMSLALARRRAACGCFGDQAEPASTIQVMLSGALALIGLGAASAAAHGVGWTLARPAIQAIGLIAAIAGSTYALIIAYVDLPRAWSAWSAG